MINHLAIIHQIDRHDELLKLSYLASIHHTGHAGSSVRKGDAAACYLPAGSGMVPLIRLYLHDHHITRLRSTFKLPESAFKPALLIKIIRILIFPPRIIHAVIVKFYPVGLPEVAHHQPPAIEVTKNKRSLEQR